MVNVVPLKSEKSLSLLDSNTKNNRYALNRDTNYRNITLHVSMSAYIAHVVNSRITLTCYTWHGLTNYPIVLILTLDCSLGPGGVLHEYPV